MSCYFCKTDGKKKFCMAPKRGGGEIKRHYTIRNVMHHIDTNRKNNSKENLIQICPKCHYKLHKLYRIYKKFLIKST